MLAGVLERLLKRYLSRWLSVTDTHLQVLNLGVWNGNLHFEQLHMLTSVLDELQLPLGLGVKLKKGMIGSMQLKCNWTRLTTQPVEITLTDVYLLGEIDPRRMTVNDPNRAAEEISQLIDPEVIRTYLHSQKEKIIEAAEETWAQFKRDTNSANQSYMSSLTASLVASILDNLSITVQRIHVCIATMPHQDIIISPPTTINPNHTHNSQHNATSTAATDLSPVDSFSESPDTASPEMVSPQPPLVDPPSLSSSSSSASNTAAPLASTPTPSASSPIDDPASNFPVGWSLGVLLNELTFHTTDKTGTATFVKSTGAHVHKRMKLDGLAVYLSSNATPLPDAAAGSDEYFMTIMAKPFEKGVELESDEIEEESEAEEVEAAKKVEVESQSDSDSSSDSEAAMESANSLSDSDADASHQRRKNSAPQPATNLAASISSSPVIVPTRKTSHASAASPRRNGTHSSTKSGAQVVDGLEYILAPCDATVRIRVSKNQHGRTDSESALSSSSSSAISSSSTTDTRAKLSVSVEVENLQLEFTSKQYEIIQALAANVASSENALRHAPFIAPRQRPGHSQQATRAWWSYALQVTRKECRERLQQWRPSFISAYRHDFQAYKPLYTAFISGKPVTSQLLTDMKYLEDDWDAHHIIMWRSLIQKSTRIKEAMAHVNKSRGKQRKKAGKQATIDETNGAETPSSTGGSVMGWLGSWLPTGGGASTNDDSDTASLRLNEEEREQILKMLGYDPYASIEGLQSSENTMKIELILGGASITLFQATIAPPQPIPKRIDWSLLPSFPLAPRTLTTRQPFIHASLHDFHVTVQQSAAGVALDLSLAHLLVEDRMASCERFSALIVPRSYKYHRSNRTDQTPFFTPSIRQPSTAVEASPLLLPASAAPADLQRAKSDESTSEAPLVQMRLSYHFPSSVPSAGTANQAHVDLWFATQPLDVVYSAGALTSLKTFLVTRTTVASDTLDDGISVLWQELEVAAMNAFQDLKRRSAAKLDYVLNHHVRIALDINIQAPTLLIYHHAANDLGSCLAINLGHVTCVTQEKHASVVEPDEIDLRKSSLDVMSSSSVWNLGQSLDAAAARERALSSSTMDADASSQDTRQGLFYDQFHLNIGNMDVQLIPLQYESTTTKGRGSMTPFTPFQGANGAFSSPIPSLQLPGAFSSISDSVPRVTSSPISSRDSRRTWLARRRNLQSRSLRSAIVGCGPVIDAFTPTVHVMSSVLPSDTSQARTKIHAHLPPVKLHLSSAKMRRIIDIFASFPSTAPQPPAIDLNATYPLPQRSSSLGTSNSSPASTLTRDSKIGASISSANRRSSSSFQISKESAMATAAEMVVNASRDRDKDKNGTNTLLPADWVMLHFHLTASQLAIDLSFDCDLPPEQLRQQTSPHYGAQVPQAPIESTIDLVNFLLDGVDLKFTKYPYSFALETQIHGLFVEDCINREQAAFRYLISSGSSPSVVNAPPVGSDSEMKDDTSDKQARSFSASNRQQQPSAAQSAITDLIYLRFHQVTDLSSTAVAASTDTLQIDLNTLQFNYNRSTFQLLMEFIQPALDAMESKPSDKQTSPASGVSDADILMLSRSVDYSASQLQGHSAPITNLSASTSSLPTHAHSTSSSSSASMHSPNTPERTLPLGASIPLTPSARSSGTATTPSSLGGFTFPAPPSSVPTQQELLSRITEKISNDGEIGSRANRTKMPISSSYFNLQARVNLIGLSLNTEKDDSIASIATTEIHGLDVSVKNQDCPCGGCLQVHATLANLTLFEITTLTHDGSSIYSRQSGARSGHRHSSIHHSLSSNSLNDHLSPIQHSDAGLRPSGSGTFGMTQRTQSRRIASKRHASDTALVTVSFTQHALVMDGSPSSAMCPIRFRTIRNTEPTPPVDPVTLSFDQTLSVDVSSIQVVFLPDFLLRLQSFLEESLLKEASDRATEVAKEALAELKQLAEANCSLMKFSIAVDNPLIFIPHTTVAPVNHPIHHLTHSPSPLPPSMGSPMASSSIPSSPMESFPMHYGSPSMRLYDDVRAVTDYLVLDLGKISIANHFELSEERHLLMPTTVDVPLYASQGLETTPTPRRRRKSVTASGRVPQENLQLRLSAMNLILASSPRLDSSSTSSISSDDASAFWQHAHKIKIFEDVNLNLSIVSVMLVPHLSFVDVENTRIKGTISTIHMHISEQLLTFLLGVYSAELASLFSSPPPPPTAADQMNNDETLEVEFEEDDEPQQLPNRTHPLPSSTLPKSASLPHISSTASLQMNVAEMAALAAAEAMASIDEEFDDESDDEAMPLVNTTEKLSTTIDLSFEGVLLDLRLTPLTDELPSASAPRAARTNTSVMSPNPSFSSSLPTPANAPLGSFAFAPVNSITPPPVGWWNWSHSSRQSHAFVQIRAQTLKVAFKSTDIIRTQIDADPIKSSLTSVELSLGHLSLEDVRAECTHPLLRQVIGGHHDISNSASARMKPHHRAGSVAFDLASNNESEVNDASSSSSSSFNLTVLPDLRVTYESLDVEQIQANANNNDQPVKSNVNVETSVDVEFTAPRLVLAPNFLTALLHFIDAYSLVLSGEESDSQSDKPQSEVSDLAPSAPSTSTTRIKARIRDPQIWLMSDAETVTPSASSFASAPLSRQLSNASTDTRDSMRESVRDHFSGSVMHDRTHIKPLSCVVLRGNIELTMQFAQVTSVQLRLADIEALMCYRANQLKLAQLNPLPVPVFQPFEIALEYRMRNSENEEEEKEKEKDASLVGAHQLTVDISRLDSCFSFLQISSAANIILALVHSIPASSNDDPTSPKPKAASPDVPAASPLAFLSSFKGRAQLRTSGIHLKLVNDAPGYYVPLLSFSVTPFITSVLDHTHNESVHTDELLDKNSAANAMPSYLPSSRFSTSIGINRSAVPRHTAKLLLTMGIQAKYYNQQLGEWDEFLAPWRYDVHADEQTIMVSSKQVLEVQVTPSCMHAIASGMDSLQSHFLAVLAAAPKPVPRSKSTSRRGRPLTPRSSSASQASMQQPTTVTRPLADRKASYFRVRNETGTRLRFWSVEIEQSGLQATVMPEILSPTNGLHAASATFMIEPNEEQTVALRQYVGVGGFGANESSPSSIREEDESKDDVESAAQNDDSNKLRWVYRSPMVGLQLEAGHHTDRWNAWQSIHAVPLVANSTEAALDATRKSAATNRLHAHANLTLHPLLPSPESDSLPYDDDIESADVSGGVIACHLVSQIDSDGSTAQVLVVSSALLLVNRTFVDMEICLVDCVDERVLFQRVVPSSHSLPMPVLLVNWRRVKLLIRPAGLLYKKQVWDWSTAGFRLSLLPHEAANHTILKCRPHESNQPLSPLQQEGQQQQDAAVSNDDLFCCGLNIFSTSSSSAIAQPDVHGSVSQLGGLDPSVEPTLYTIALDPPLSFKNLLGADVSYQVRERKSGPSYQRLSLNEMVLKDVRTGFLPHRHEVHWYHMDLGAGSSSVVTLQLRRYHTTQDRIIEGNKSNVATPRSSISRSAPSLHSLPQSKSQYTLQSVDDSSEWGPEWSPEVVIHSTTSTIHPSRQLLLHDIEGTRLGIELDYSGARDSAHRDTKIKSSSASVYPYAHAGHGLVTASVPYWFANHSGLPLIYASMDEMENEKVCAGQSARALEQAAQALIDLEGVDELAQRTINPDLPAISGIDQKNRSWFHFRQARLQFGTETRTGLQSLLDDPDHEGVNTLPEWRWTPQLMQRPLDENVFLLSPVAEIDEFERQQQQQHPPVEVMMLPTRHGGQLRALIRLPNTEWSQPFQVDTVGWDGALQLTEVPRSAPSEDHPMTDSAYDLPPQSDRPLRVYSIGVSICMHAHLRYYRTKIIQFSPRYVLSNQTLHTLEFRQTKSQEVRTIAPKQSVPIHWLDRGGPAAISLRVGSYGWQWAAKRFGIALESIGVFSVRLRNTHTHDMAVLHVWIKLVGATFEITVLATWEQQRNTLAAPPVSNTASELEAHHRQMSNVQSNFSNSAAWMNQQNYLGSPGMNELGGVATSITLNQCADDRDLQEKMSAETSSMQEPVPYRIENCSSMRTLLFHQSDEPKLKQRLLPYQSCPYAWDEPLGRKEIVLYCLSSMGTHTMHDDTQSEEEQRVGSYSLDKIAKYDPVSLRRYGPSSQDVQFQDQVVAQVYADGRVRVLKLVDLTFANSAGLNATQASLNAKASTIPSPAAVVGWSVEVRLAGIGLSLITHVHRAGPSSAFATSMSLSTSHLRAPSSTLGVSSSTSHPLALLGVPHTRQELLYLSIHNIRVHLTESNTNQALRAAIGHIQLDNQLHSALYPVVLCSVSKPQQAPGWFSSRKKQSSLPELDLDDDFFLLHPTSSGILTAKGRTRAQRDLLPCWFSVALLKSHDRSTSDFLFLPGLAVRMQLLKINVEEQLINHLVRFSELLGPAIALMSKPRPSASSASMPVDIDAPHHFTAQPILERQTSAALLEIAMHDGSDFNSPIAVRTRPGDALSPASNGSVDDEPLTPNSLTDSMDDAAEADDFIHPQHFTGVVGQFDRPSSYAHGGGFNRQTSRSERAQSDVHHGASSQVVVARKLDRPFILYFQHFLVEPIEIRVSMSSSGEQVDALAGGSSHPLRAVLRFVGATLLNIDNASLKFGSLDLPDVFASGEELGALVQLHYKRQATRQAHNLIGSAEFIGNPVALFGSISTGLSELVYQPVAGLTQSPVGVVTGALGGVRSFAQHTIYGVTSTMRGLLSSFGKGLSSASLGDPHRPGHALRVRLRELPMRGWRRAGLPGFIGGCFRSMLGFTGNIAHSLSSGVDRVRALVNPIPKLQRQREPLFFQIGMKPMLFHMDVARFIAGYLALHQDETFVACVEQQGMTPLNTIKLFGMSLSGHGVFVSTSSSKDVISSASAASSAAAAASSSSSSAVSSPAGTPIRAPPGARICVLLTTHTLVIFCVFPHVTSSSNSHRRLGLVLREIPLELVTLPILANEHHTILTLETHPGEVEFARTSAQRAGRSGARRFRDRRGGAAAGANTHAASSSALPSFLHTWLPFLFGPATPISNVESLLLPVHISKNIVGIMELLTTAARATAEANMRTRGGQLAAGMYR